MLDNDQTLPTTGGGPGAIHRHAHFLALPGSLGTRRRSGATWTRTLASAQPSWPPSTSR